LHQVTTSNYNNATCYVWCVTTAKHFKEHVFNDLDIL